MATAADAAAADALPATPATRAARFFAWCGVTILLGFFLNVYLSFWVGWPGPGAVFDRQASATSWLQVLIYVAGVVGPVVFVARTPGRALRADAAAMGAVSTYIVKASFWIVVLVGAVDAVISFLRVEDLLPALVGDQMASDLGRNRFRGPYVHGPLIVASLVLAATTRTLGFTWLALLVVVAELQIVVSRFVFSYEQAFMGDLVRMWYAGLFLFSSAYTLVEDGHVRVDVLYSAFTTKTRGMVNAVGSIVLGLPLCWTILILGMSQPSSIITSPLLSWEVTQSGFGMYIKYLMAAFLAVFAASMAIQFCAYVLEGIADFRGDQGGRKSESAAAH
jgi:TRAP-type mannitol/chloroaromatic compound transport system permease small subunit